MKIRIKLLIIPAVGFLFLLILLGMVYWGLDAQRKTLDNIYVTRFQGYRFCTNLYERILVYHSDLYKMIAWSGSGYDEDKIVKMGKAGTESIGRINADIEAASKSSVLDAEEKALYGKSLGQMKDYADWSGRVIGMVASDLSIANMFMGTAEDKMTVLRETLESLNAVELRLSDEAYRAAARNSDFVLAMIVTIFLVAIAASVAVALLFSRQIMRSVETLMKRAEDLSQGTGDLTLTIDVGTRDEIGDLGRSLNGFIAKLERIVAGVKAVSERTKGIGGALSRIAIDTSADTREISVTIKSSKETIQKLDGEIQNTAGNVNEIVQHISLMAKSVEDQSAAVTQSSASIEEIAASIHNISSIMEQKKELSDRLSRTAAAGLAKMEESSEAIAKVARSTDSVVSLVDVINGITANLNLLAMNAAIEAAHAGDSGRGFAVVADEVRKLAEETAVNAKSIADTLKQTVNDMQSSIRTNQTAKGSIEELMAGIKDIISAMEETRSGMSELSVGSSEIVKAVESLMAVTTEIRERSSGIDTNAKSISAAMGRVSGLSTQTSTGMEEITTAVFHASEAMTRLSEVGKENERNLLEIDRELGQFKTRVP